MSSRRFLLRRVWHLAIPTPPAMGYSPTEYAEFTEPPTEMSSHGFHRFTQILRVRCSPTEFTESTEPPTEMSSHGFHRLTQIVRCAVLPQNSQNTQNLAAWVWHGCHTLLICEHLCSSVGGSSLPEGSVCSVRSAGISFLPRMARIDTDCYGALFSHGMH